MKYYYCLLSILAINLFSCQELKSEEEKDYEVGFKTTRIYDKARRYLPGVDSTNSLYYRPLDIDIWYPAQESPNDSLIKFGEYFNLFEQRVNFYTASTIGNGMSGKFAGTLAEGFKCSDSIRVLKHPTKTYRQTKPIDGNFPVVVYMASYNGMAYENYLLFETLVKKGYVVVGVNSIGRFPGDMTMMKEDAMEQVYDAIAAIKYLEKHSTVKFDNVAVMGYSWGGLTGALAADKIPNVKCIVSLEGSEFHHYGYSKEEDADFEGILKSPDFQKMSLKNPYLRFESAPVNQKTSKDSVNNFLAKVSKDYLVLKVDSAEHGDFSAYPFIVKSSGNCPTTQLYQTITRLISAYLEEHLKGNRVFNKVFERELNRSLRKRQ